jgi:hypothetical protein
MIAPRVMFGWSHSAGARADWHETIRWPGRPRPAAARNELVLDVLGPFSIFLRPFFDLSSTFLLRFFDLDLQATA